MAIDGRPLAELRVSEYTDVIGPDVPMIGPLADEGILIAHSVQGCWGPMITPELRGGHEVTQPVAVAGAEVGDAIALSIKRIAIHSKAAASGTDAPVAGRFLGDAAIGARCPSCGAARPASYLRGIGIQAVRCRMCDAEIIPFTSPNGYTMVFDDDLTLALTVDRASAERIALSHADYSGIWPGARQHPAIIMALGDMPGVLTRIRPMVGNIGTSPAVRVPASKNAGDVAPPLVEASHDMPISAGDLGGITDGHMDIDSVGEGTILICPVKIAGGGIYVGDAHAMQGDGETAGHTTDVAAEVVLGVSVIKGLAIDGPILLPRWQDLPPLARPFSDAELSRGAELARSIGVEWEGPVAPVQVVGSGPDLTSAVKSGLGRLSRLSGMSLDEVRNRVTITGAIEIGRLPGIVQVTAFLPLRRLDELGLGALYRKQYELP
jgi:formamidase